MASAFSTKDTARDPVKRAATYADLEAVPAHLVAEILDGALVSRLRPPPRHAVAANSLGAELTGPFQKSTGGPGGWLFMVEPELHLGGHVVVPDLAAWRRERLREMPDAAFVDIAPDWVCEVLSATTERSDRGRKRRIYAEVGVTHLWLLDPRFQQLEAFSLADVRWMLDGTWTADAVAHAPPFDAFALSLADLWPLDRPLGFEESPQALFHGDR